MKFSADISGFQWMAKVPNTIEILPKISTAIVGCTSVADDRQTDDRQTTDGRAIAYSEREREFTFAKKLCLCSVFNASIACLFRVIGRLHAVPISVQHVCPMPPSPGPTRPFCM